VRQNDAGIADVVQRVYGQHDVERPVLGRHIQDAATLVVDVGPGPFGPSDVQHSICDVDREHSLGVVGQQDAVPPRSTPEVNGRGHPLGQVREDPVVEAAADAVPDPGEAVEQVRECVEVGGVLGRDGGRRLGHRGPISFASFGARLCFHFPASVIEASRYALVASASGVASAGRAFFWAP
jgi:hypothetical protein